MLQRQRLQHVPGGTTRQQPCHQALHTPAAAASVRRLAAAAARQCRRHRGVVANSLEKPGTPSMAAVDGSSNSSQQLPSELQGAAGLASPLQQQQQARAGSPARPGREQQPSGGQGHLQLDQQQHPQQPQHQQQQQQRLTWVEWRDHFDAQDAAGSALEELSSRLAACIAAEDYEAAARHKARRDDLAAADAVAAASAALTQALEDEDYEAAARLRDESWALLEGWWVSAQPDDALGHLLRIAPEYGRLTGKLHTVATLARVKGYLDEAEDTRPALAPASSSSSGGGGDALSWATQQARLEALGSPALEVFLRQQGADPGEAGSAAAAAAAGSSVGALVSQAVLLQAEEEWLSLPQSAHAIEALEADLFAAAVAADWVKRDEREAFLPHEELQKQLDKEGFDPLEGMEELQAMQEEMFRQSQAAEAASSLADELSGPGTPRVSVGYSFTDRRPGRLGRSSGDAAAAAARKAAYDPWGHLPLQPAELEALLTAAGEAADQADGGLLCADSVVRRQQEGSDAAAAAPGVPTALQLLVELRLPVEGEDGSSGGSGSTLVAARVVCSQQMGQQLDGSASSSSSSSSSEGHDWRVARLPPGPRMVPDWAALDSEAAAAAAIKLAQALEWQYFARCSNPDRWGEWWHGTPGPVGREPGAPHDAAVLHMVRGNGRVMCPQFAYAADFGPAYAGRRRRHDVNRAGGSSDADSPHDEDDDAGSGDDDSRGSTTTSSSSRAGDAGGELQQLGGGAYSGAAGAAGLASWDALQRDGGEEEEGGEGCSSSSSSSSSAEAGSASAPRLQRRPALIAMQDRDSFTIQVDTATEAAASAASAGAARVLFLVQMPVEAYDAAQQETNWAAQPLPPGFDRVWQLAAHQVLQQHTHQDAGAATPLGLPITWRQPLADVMQDQALRVLDEQEQLLQQQQQRGGAGAAASSSTDSADDGDDSSSSGQQLQLRVLHKAPVLVVRLRQPLQLQPPPQADTSSSSGSSSNRRRSSHGSAKAQYRRLASFAASTPNSSSRRAGSSRAYDDPLQGLFIGKLGSTGPQLLQLQRGACPESGEAQVVARKVTGDLQVPAGEVAFRATIPARQRDRLRADVYPSELDVVARFAGEGRLAAPGSRNGPSWVDGELLQFRSPPRPDSLTEGAGLGFLWQPDGSGSKRYLVLLKKVALETL